MFPFANDFSIWFPMMLRYWRFVRERPRLDTKGWRSKMRLWFSHRVLRYFLCFT